MNDLRIEAALSAYRERLPDGTVVPSKDWRDLDPEARQRAYEEAYIQRRLEAALDAEGLSTTSRAVLARIRTAKNPSGA